MSIKISIKQRIYWSFSLLVFLFVINGIVTILTLKSNKKLAVNIFKIFDPSIQTLDDFKKIMLESKMYTTNWVFLSSDTEDKRLLKNVQDSDYPKLKLRLNAYSTQWNDKKWVDSINRVYAGFEELLAIEKNIMGSLNELKDYDNPVIKLEAERKVQEEILPRTSVLLKSLKEIHSLLVSSRAEQGGDLERSSTKLRMLILVLIISIIIAGFLLSVYLTRVIIGPVNRIRNIINNLGQGIIQKIDQHANDDEIGKMISSVNNLSEKLQVATTFAYETGLRNFDMPFKPISEEDALGKALLAMRENLKTSETNLAIQNRELEQKNKELEQFAYVASHDLQEPLRTTSSFSELLQRQYKGKLDEKADKYLTFINQSSDRMKVLIQDLLDYSRIGRKKELEQVDCNIILKEVLADIDVAIKETQAEINFCRLPVIKGSATEIKQLFQNLIINAIKFRRENESPVINICARKKNRYWEFSCRDNGIGISDEHSERIFIIFQRLHTRSEYEGSGIGLAHCKKIVEMHGGKIWLESEPSCGSTFYFTIPEKNN